VFSVYTAMTYFLDCLGLSSSFVCLVSPNVAGALARADDIVLIAPAATALRRFLAYLLGRIGVLHILRGHQTQVPCNTT
jgi:hypothetical protein